MLKQGYKPENEEDWPVFVRTWYSLYKPDSIEMLIEQLKDQGIVNNDVPDALRDSAITLFKSQI